MTAASAMKARAGTNETAPRKARTGKASTGKVALMEDAGAPTLVAVAGAGTERAYRRMPDDLAQVVALQTSDVTALADLYDVPTQTARSWLATLRRRQRAAS